MKPMLKQIKQLLKPFPDKGTLWFSLFFFFGQLSLSTFPLEARQLPNEVKNLLKNVRNRDLKRFVKLCAAPKAKKKHYMKALLLAFLEKKQALPIVQYLIIRAKRREKELHKNFLMEKALAQAPLDVVAYLLQEGIYDEKMLQGKKSYPFRKMVHIFWSRFLSSMGREPYWMQFITTYIVPIKVMGSLLFLYSICNFFKIIPQRLEKILGMISKIGSSLSIAFKIARLTWNALYILYIAYRLYQQGYLILVLRGYRSQQEKKALVELLLRHGADPLQRAFFIFFRAKESQASEMALYRFKEKGPIHFAIAANNLEIVALLYEANPEVLYQVAYTIEDPTPESSNEEGQPMPTLFGKFSELILIQTIYTKRGDKKEIPYIKEQLPKSLAREGSRMHNFFLEKEAEN